MRKGEPIYVPKPLPTPKSRFEDHGRYYFRIISVICLAQLAIKKLRLGKLEETFLLAAPHIAFYHV